VDQDHADDPLRLPPGGGTCPRLRGGRDSMGLVNARLGWVVYRVPIVERSSEF
jgi:hypothetical protein